MITQLSKRFLSFLLAMVMIFSMVPLQALAVEHDDHDHSEAVTTAPDSDEERSVYYQNAQNRIDAILVDYLGSTTVTAAELQAAVDAMDWETYQTARWEIMLLEESDFFAQMTDVEIQTLLNANSTFLNFSDALDIKAAEDDDSISTYASKTVTVGDVSITDDQGTGSVSNGTVTITAKGSLFSKKTNSITVTNTSSKMAQLSFDYTVDKSSSFKIAGADAATSGSYSVMLGANASLSITLVSNSGLSNTTATLKMSNISLAAVKENSDVTFAFDSELGSVTAGGTAVVNGETQTVSGTTGVELKATAKSGAVFLGWTDAEGMILSTAATYTLIPAKDTTVRAVFAQNGGTPWFAVGATASKSQSTGLLGLSSLTYYQVAATHLYNDLAAAADAANGKTMVLMNNATLPAGDYTIPAGVTLLIPFDSSNTMYKTEAVSISYESYTTPTTYRTLTLADGANLIINGSMSLSAKHCYANGSKLNGGSPTGNVSFVKMEGDSKITVNNGGNLYVYGFITGSGSVEAMSGAKVYENFQIMDFRGGSQSTDMENGVFPLSQYYIQNIEVPLTLYSGATEYAYTTVYMSSADFGSAVAFIAAKDAMFNLTSGYVVKKYDGTTDRLIVEAYGNMTVSAINMSVGTSSINSKNYDLPINSNMTVKAGSGSFTINQDIAMLPGSVIEIGEDATCTLGSSNNI